jgi:hypothetical protein
MNTVDSAVLADRMVPADSCLSAEHPSCRHVGGESVANASEVTGHRARAMSARLGLPQTGFLLNRTRLRTLVEPVWG